MALMTKSQMTQLSLGQHAWGLYIRVLCHNITHNFLFTCRLPVIRRPPASPERDLRSPHLAPVLLSSLHQGQRQLHPQRACWQHRAHTCSNGVHSHKQHSPQTSHSLHRNSLQRLLQVGCFGCYHGDLGRDSFCVCMPCTVKQLIQAHPCSICCVQPQGAAAQSEHASGSDADMLLEAV